MKVMSASKTAFAATTTPPAGEVGVDTIAVDFGGAAHRSNDYDDHDEDSDDSDSDSDCHGPPPPRDDSEEDLEEGEEEDLGGDDDNEGEEEEDDGSSASEDHFGRHRGWQGRTRMRPHGLRRDAAIDGRDPSRPDAGAAHAPLDLEEDVDDSLLFFGEDTMHALMDAELRLNRVVPPPPRRRPGGASPPVDYSAWSSSSSPSDSSSFEGDNCVDDDHVEGSANDDDKDRDFFKIGNEPRGSGTRKKDATETTPTTTSKMTITTGGIVWNHDDDDDGRAQDGDVDDGLSAGEASLLRGPIMAFRSAAIAMSGGHIGEFLAVEATNDHTSDAGVGGGGGATSHNRHRRRDSVDTPSKVQDGISSPPTALTPSFDGHCLKSTEKSPSTARKQFLTSPQIQRHLLHPSLFEQQQQQQQQELKNSIPPSAARRDVVTSPQDSVSTIGVRSPSEGYRDEHAGGGNNAGRTRGFNFDMPDQMLFDTDSVRDTHNRAAALVKKYAGGVVANYNAAKPSSIENNDADSRTKNASSSVEIRIALGEEQMRKNCPEAAPATASAAASNCVLEEPKKRPYLRKGTRKEPSALHATTVTSRNNNSNISRTSNSDWITPSTARRQQRSNDNDLNSISSSLSPNAAASPSPTTTAAAAGISNESLSERPARLARLEKMQEDLIKDLERRQARKEEAQRERCRMMTAGNSRKAVAVGPANSLAATVANRAIAALAATTENHDVAVTPSNARSKSSAVAPSSVGGGGHAIVRTITTSLGVQGEEVETPSQARQNSFGEQMTPSQVRTEHQQQQQKTPSNVRADQQRQETSVTSNKDPSTTRQQDSKDNITSSHARRNIDLSSSTKKKSSPSIDVIIDNYISEGYNEDHAVVDDGVEAGYFVEGKAVNFPGGDKENVGGNSGERGYVVAKKGLKSSSAIRQVGSQPMRRSTSAARMPGTRSNKTAKMRCDGKSSLSVNDDERMAFEEWKKKEEGQWALIKNMRRRQEVALREAEGERERAKAWAAAEKESVQKWVNEQRALIKKDRHKAANAALVASKGANKVRQQEDARNSQEQKAMQAELEELRFQMKKLKEKDNAEMKKLKEVILRQEGRINALKCAKGDGRGGGGGGGGGAINNPTRSSKSPSSGHTGSIRERGVRDGSSKHNILQQRPKSKASIRKTSTNAHDSPKNTQNEELMKYLATSLKEVNERTIVPMEEAEEPTELWLQRHLSKLIDANNNLGANMTDGRNKHDSNCVKCEHPNATDNEIEPQYYDKQQRKPYNAADYGGKSRDHFHTQPLSRTINHNSNPTVPSFVISAAPNPSLHATPSSEEGVLVQPLKSQIITYNNGTQKEISPDGTTTISFTNGDRKRTYADEKKGVVVYYYASTKCAVANPTFENGLVFELINPILNLQQTTQVTHQDGMQTYHFPNKQVENHYTDGSKEITFPDGTTRVVNTDGSTDTTFPEGIRVIDYPDGTQRVIHGC
ncbi:hypothetical protein ACHAW5_010456 [Stephanodiscus triporus]|uniref:Centromere protein J C-terminal domain-containing protein n=1 Tax=Stephanodiscus triporus TaxID=2934178 RepID=A0ABD3Q316_9STRA